MKKNKKHFFSFDQVKQSFAHFKKRKGRYFQTFKNYYLCNFLWFFDTLPILRNWTCKNIQDRQQCAHFRKLLKSAISLHPTGQQELICYKIYFIESHPTSTSSLGLSSIETYRRNVFCSSLIILFFIWCQLPNARGLMSPNRILGKNSKAHSLPKIGFFK